MKQIKKIITSLTAVVLCLVSLFGNTMSVRAEGNPVTYFIKYVDSQNAWRFQTGGWSDSVSPRDLYYMNEEIKDGDIIVIDGGADTQKEITLEVKVSLSNLTVMYSDMAIVTAKSVDEFFSLNDSICVVNGPVKKAYVYDYSLGQFNSDVESLEVISSSGDILHATVGTGGTVAHVKAHSPSYTHFEFYNFAKGTLSITDGSLKTDEAHFSKAPVAATPAPEAPAAPAAPATPAAPADSASSEYDDVPKTADIRFNPLWFVLLASVCFAGSYALKKEK